MQLTRNPDVGTPRRDFIPEDFDPTDKTALEEQVNRLLDMPVEETEDLEVFLRYWSELGSMIDAAKARRYIAMTCDTVDEAIKESYLSFERDVVPFYSQLDDRLDRKYLASPAREKLSEHYSVFDRGRKTKAELFREENTLLDAEDSELHAKYLEIQGAITVEIDLIKGRRRVVVGIELSLVDAPVLIGIDPIQCTGTGNCFYSSNARRNTSLGCYFQYPNVTGTSYMSSTA